MGHINDLYFVKRNIKLIQGPILDVGSKYYGVNTQDFRSLFPDHDYVGVDMQEGKCVDVVSDLTDNFNLVNKKLNGRRFKTVFFFSVLEHCKNPFKMCSNISRLLDKDGILLVNAPFACRIHGYPSDYWRFTPEGIKALFPDLDFGIYEGSISTSNIGELKPIDNYMFRAELSISKGLKLKRYGYFTAAFIYLCRNLRILPSIFTHSYVFPPVMVNMIGKKI